MSFLWRREQTYESNNRSAFCDYCIALFTVNSVTCAECFRELTDDVDYVSRLMVLSSHVDNEIFKHTWSYDWQLISTVPVFCLEPNFYVVVINVPAPNILLE
jgi:hypothetical protein